MTCGRPSRSASIAGTTPMAPSVEAMPHTTRSTGSTPIFSTALASTSEVASASEPAIASSMTWTPLSAPICSALRTASTAFSGPTHSAVTSTSSPALLLDLEGLLDGVLVELGQQPVDADAVDGVVGLELAGRRWRPGRTSHRRQCSWCMARTGPSCALGGPRLPRPGRSTSRCRLPPVTDWVTRPPAWRDVGRRPVRGGSTRSRILADDQADDRADAPVEQGVLGVLRRWLAV